MRKAKSPAELGFDRYDQQRLKRDLKRVSDKRTFQRLKALLLVAQGHAIKEVAQIIDVSVQIIYHWIAQYLKRHDVKSLYDQPRSGRPTSAKRITDARIIREVRRNPLALGYNTTVWTVMLLARHLSTRYACPINSHTLRRRMKRIGLRCKRPRYVYAEKDPHRAQKKGRLFAS